MPTQTPRRRPSTAARTAQERKGAAVEYKGKTFTVPTRANQISIETLEAMEANNLVTATRELLGEKQYQSLREVVKTAADLNEFFEIVQRRMQLGES